MLYDYVETNSNTVTHSYHDNFMDELQAAGFPKGTTQRPTMNLAIVNGGPTDIADSLLTHSNHYIDAIADLGPIPLSLSVLEQILSQIISSLAGYILDPDKRISLLYFLPGASHIHYDLQVNGDRASNGEKMRFIGTYIKTCIFNFYHTLVENIRTTGGHIQYLEESPGSTYTLSDNSELNGSVNNFLFSTCNTSLKI